MIYSQFTYFFGLFIVSKYYKMTMKKLDIIFNIKNNIN